MRITKLLRGLLGVGHLVVICGWQLESGDRPRLVVQLRLRSRRRARGGRCGTVAPL